MTQNFFTVLRWLIDRAINWGHNLQMKHTHILHIYIYTVHHWQSGDLWNGLSMRDKVNHRGKIFLTLISLVIHYPFTKMTATHHLCPLLSKSHTSTPMLTKNVPWHETAMQHMIQTSSIMFLSAWLLFSYLGWWCCTEFKCSNRCSVLSREPTHTSFL